MTVLFDRRIDVTVDTIQITGLDVSFKVEKTLKAEPNTCECSIFNLNEQHRAQLEELKPTSKQATQGIPCRIEGGYKDQTSLLWLGDLRDVVTERDGADWVTLLTSGDGEKAWKHAELHVSFGPKTALVTALRAIARSLGVAEGNLSKVVAKLQSAGKAIFPAGATFSGPASRELNDFARSAGLEVSIQDGALQFLDRGQALAGKAIELNEERGLIGSPSVDRVRTRSARQPGRVTRPVKTGQSNSRARGTDVR